MLEFSCEIYIDIFGGSTTIDISFDIDGSPPSPYEEISVTCLSSDLYLRSSFIMRYNIQSSSAGVHVVKILTYINEDYTTSYVKYSILTATIY
ncbi:MAG: hypothetical protein KGD65_14370 [Candidatus Lokiarchaeota archaeon]|nr:hypothetical protein [Candidatus Lokiarchaeota archaeon]